MAMLNMDFQERASEDGQRFHEECVRALLNAGFEILEQKMTIPEVGIEIDARTANRNGIEMLWEFKGSEKGGRPGLHRTDTLKKAIANGYLLSRWAEHDRFMPLLVMTSHMPGNKNGSPKAMSDATERHIILEIVNSRDYARLTWFYRAAMPQLEELQNE